MSFDRIRLLAKAERNGSNKQAYCKHLLFNTFIMKKGKVKFFNQAKGFGFITDENGQDVFVHVSGLQQDIQENDQVTFELQEGRKGPSATRVQLV